MLKVVKLYNEIYRTMTEDEPLLTKMGFVSSGNVNQDRLFKARRFQKRSTPQNLAVENMPTIAFYTSGGNYDITNSLVYNPVFYFDIYTNDNVDLAHAISEDIQGLFGGKINYFQGIDTLVADVLEAHESLSDLPNTYCFTLVISFSIET
jgi:hypothetical protein